MKLPEFPDYDFFIINEDVVVVNKQGKTLKGNTRPGQRSTVYFLRYHTGKDDYVYVSNGRLAIMMQFDVTYRHLKEKGVKSNFVGMETPSPPEGRGYMRWVSKPRQVSCIDPRSAGHNRTTAQGKYA